MNRQMTSHRKTLTVVLSLVFLLAMVMGTGPGIYLINPDPTEPNVDCSFLGVPVIYGWAVFWFLVQAVVVLIAYFRLW